MAAACVGSAALARPFARGSVPDRADFCDAGGFSSLALATRTLVLAAPTVSGNSLRVSSLRLWRLLLVDVSTEA